MSITYEKIENIAVENHAELLADLEQRTGLSIHDFAITKVDFLRDVARIKIRYQANRDEK